MFVLFTIPVIRSLPITEIPKASTKKQTEHRRHHHHDEANLPLSPYILIFISHSLLVAVSRLCIVPMLYQQLAILITETLLKCWLRSILWALLTIYQKHGNLAEMSRERFLYCSCRLALNTFCQAPPHTHTFQESVALCWCELHCRIIGGMLYRSLIRSSFCSTSNFPYSLVLWVNGWPSGKI